MFNLFKKVATVEEIHQEFDSAEERIMNECDKLLSSLKIPTESALERKAQMLNNLGFINSETVHRANEISSRKEKIQDQLKLTNLQVETIKELKFKYPFEKFITVDELERICKKYDLIYAPVSKYIKDVPEKNVLEMSKCKKLERCDMYPQSSMFNHIEFCDFHTTEYKKFVKKNVLNKPFHDDINPWTPYRIIFERMIKDFKGDIGDNSIYYRDLKVKEIDRNGLFISAPKSHFNLDGLSKEGLFGFFSVTTTEVKDPVVFEFCKNDICRIITKWGTDDDQSYLDSTLTNETLN